MSRICQHWEKLKHKSSLGRKVSLLQGLNPALPPAPHLSSSRNHERSGLKHKKNTGLRTPNLAIPNPRPKIRKGTRAAEPQNALELEETHRQKTPNTKTPYSKFPYSESPRWDDLGGGSSADSAGASSTASHSGGAGAKSCLYRSGGLEGFKFPCKSRLASSVATQSPTP